ncbi:MAG: glycosyltransferase, partial [Calditrichaeota bacterium]|nr:glycosyltransferase [Calditrichota bacterium]
DVTTAMRWIYHYFMPLSIRIPKTDIAHTTIAGFSGIVGCISKLEYGTPLLVTEHGVFIRERYFAISASKISSFAKYFLMRMSVYITRLIYHLADQISPVANFNKRWELRFGAAPHKIVTIYNGIDPHVFVPGEKPGATRGTPTVVAATNIMPLKDIETMIRACEIVRKEIQDVQFRVYGSKQVDPAYTKKCKVLIKDLGLQDHFLLAGYHNNPAEIYNEGDVTALSSISEAFPYTVLESMACARPVVATDVGGVREALEGFGILVPPRDAQALANGLVTLLKDIELRQRLGKEGRERVLLMFRISQSINAYLNTYKALMASHGKKSTKQNKDRIRQLSTEQLVSMWRDAL